MAESLYQKIAKELEYKIRHKELAVNERLSERKLATEYDVSRTVIREALKLLKEKGLVETKNGIGSCVTIPNKDDVRKILENAISNSDVQRGDVVEARDLLESAVASIIVERVTNEEIDLLRDLHKEMDDCVEDGYGYAESDAQFHLNLMKITKNEMVQLLMEAVNNMTNRNVILRAKEVRENAQKEHRFMILALENRDCEKLKNVFHQHTLCVKKHLNL